MIREPEYRYVPLRTPVMHRWAMECLRDFDIHHRDGADWVIVHVSQTEATLQQLIRINLSPRVGTSNCCVCGCTDLIRYSSLNMKQCPDCKIEIPWHLSDGQLPLVGSNRQDRKLNIDVNDGLVNNGVQTTNNPE